MNEKIDPSELCWIRLNILEKSLKVNERSDLDKILEDSRNIENFVLGRVRCNVLPFKGMKHGEKS